MLLRVFRVLGGKSEKENSVVIADGKVWVPIHLRGGEMREKISSFGGFRRVSARKEEGLMGRYDKDDIKQRGIGSTAEAWCGFLCCRHRLFW